MQILLDLYFYRKGFERQLIHGNMVVFFQFLFHGFVNVSMINEGQNWLQLGVEAWDAMFRMHTFNCFVKLEI